MMKGTADAGDCSHSQNDFELLPLRDIKQLSRVPADPELTTSTSSTFTTSPYTVEDAVQRMAKSCLPNGLLSIPWNASERYEVVSRLGYGAYSHVFLAYDTWRNKMVVAKVLQSMAEEYVFREYVMLMKLKGGPNVVELLDVVKNSSACCGIFILEYIESVDFRVLLLHLTDKDIRYYLFQLLTALAYAHSQDIVHRDVKETNLCINPQERVLKVIDWGMAIPYDPRFVSRTGVGSLFFRAPELLVNLPDYDYRVDTWSFGCIMGGWIFHKLPLFHGINVRTQLERIVDVVGGEVWQHFCDNHNVSLRDGDVLQWGIGMGKRKKPWKSFVDSSNQHLCPPEALGLLEQLLQVDYTTRLHAKEALNHSYFNPVRSSVDVV